MRTRIVNMSAMNLRRFARIRAPVLRPLRVAPLLFVLALVLCLLLRMLSMLTPTVRHRQTRRVIANM